MEPQGSAVKAEGAQTGQGKGHLLRLGLDGLQEATGAQAKGRSGCRGIIYQSRTEVRDRVTSRGAWSLRRL